MIDLAIVENNRAFTKTLLQMFKLSGEMQSIAEFGSAEACLAAYEEEPPAADIILLDLRLPGRDGMSLVPFLREKAPESRILILTQDNDYHTTLEAIRLGVSGYVLKSSGSSSIERAVREVYAGACVIDPQLSRLVLDTLGKGDQQDDSPLSPREQEILELLAMGYVKKEVADHLNISYSTVAAHTEHIYEKLRAPNAPAAVASAIRRGLI